MKWLIVFLAAAVVALSLTIWPGGRLNVRDAATPVAAARSQGPSASVKRTVQGIGYVEPAAELRRLVFKSEGVIASVPVEIGQWVEAGELLMTLDSRDEAADFAVAEQELEVARAEREQLVAGMHQQKIAAATRRIERLEEQVRHDEKHRDRIAKLHDRKTSTQAERDDAETNVRQSQAALAEAQAELASLEEHVRPVDRALADSKVAQAEARLEAARARLEETSLHAPSAGTVLEILRREGEASHGPMGEAAIVFADDSRLRVRAEIDERYVSLLREGQAARVFGRGLGDAQFDGRVSVVKRLMGNKTVFSRASSERKDLDVLQVLIDMPQSFRAPLGLQVDVEIQIEELGHGGRDSRPPR